MSEYGLAVDSAIYRWSVLENEHDKIHPNRSDCGGVGGCSLMEAAVDLKHELIEHLEEYRKRVRP